MKKVKKRKIKYRLLLLFIFFCGVISALSYNLFNYLKQIGDLKETKNELVNKINDLKDEEEILNSDINKLKDPNYISKYAREKYMYSKNGELIIRIDD